MSPEHRRKLVRMANQIAQAFEGQGGQASRDAAAHLRAFWTPAMRAEIIRRLEAGGEELTPAARAAVAQLDELQAADPRA